MSYAICAACKHSGVIAQAKEKYQQEWEAGANVEIVLYQCPFCGYQFTKAITHGVPITAAEKSTLEGMYPNLELS